MLRFCRRAFVLLVISLPSGVCKKTSVSFVGWRVISKDSAGVESRSGLIDLVVKVVCLGGQPLSCGGGMGGLVRVFYRMSALVCV